MSTRSTRDRRSETTVLVVSVVRGPRVGGEVDRSARPDAERARAGRTNVITKRLGRSEETKRRRGRATPAVPQCTYTGRRRAIASIRSRSSLNACGSACSWCILA
ncbi:t48.1 [Tupaiid betaherpesvirus 1]|uniref:T48.1 n=1 Tax=Tupaiid herpesvirus 1 (strain 1) TaxID=10397 RepID=Q91TP0_TUHV1|nr:t48.1 [Tupaiid betaherpesvirus 1]AAK57097.1 t48.1 [Tupaiid betaherpesvirus 1]